MLRRDTFATTAYRHQVEVGHNWTLSRHGMLHPIRHNAFEQQQLAFIPNSAVTTLDDSNRCVIVKGVNDS